MMPCELGHGWRLKRGIPHELIGFARAILHEHLREMRKAKMDKGFYSYLDFANGSWKEFLTSSVAFFPDRRHHAAA
jgi:hypothetical protein